MFNHLIINKKTSSELIISRSRVKAIIELVFITIFFILWYSFLIDDMTSFQAIKKEILEKISEQKVLIVFFLAPLFSIKRILLSVSTILNGNIYIFSFTKKKVLHNRKEICKFRHIKQVQVRRIYDGDGDHTFRLSVIFNDTKKMFVAESGDRSYIDNIASDIADI